MQNNEFYKLILDVSHELNLHPAIVEKDWHVTRAIAALSELSSEGFTLVFSGGTALAKAHRLVNRMSEDVDFKVILTEASQTLSTSALRKKLSQLRENIYQSLNSQGFACTPENIRSRNNNHYLNINLPYQTTAPVNSYLRPAIKVELTVSTLQMPTNVLPVTTLVGDAIGNNVEFPQAQVNCISVIETAAEKWVALLRRIAMADKGYSTLNRTLIRHLYDLLHIFTTHKITDEFQTLIGNIITTDQRQFKHQYPEFVENPLLEIQRGLRLVEHDMNLKNDWENFISAMVFDKKAPKYEQAFETLKSISNPILIKLKNSLSNTQNVCVKTSSRHNNYNIDF